MQTKRIQRLGVGLALSTALAVASLPVSASYAQYDYHLTVDGTTYSCDYAGLSAAIDAVNEVWNGVITLNCPGQNIYFPANGAKTIRGGFVLDGLDANSARLDVAAGVDTQFFIIEPNASVILRNITLQNAKHAGSGGAILIKGQGQLALESSVIANCEATGGGGAISMEGEGWITLRSSELIGNVAHRGGGAIEAHLGYVVIANSKLSYNGGSSTIYAKSVQLTTSHFNNNGDSLIYGADVLQIDDSLFENNGNVIAHPRVATINSSVFRNNAGRAIFSWNSSDVTITHSEFSANQETAISLSGYSNLVVDTSVFVGGNATGYAAITFWGSYLAQNTVIIQNSVFSDNLTTYILEINNPFTLTNVSFTNNYGGLRVIDRNNAFLDNVTFSNTRGVDIEANCTGLTIANSTISHYNTTGAEGQGPTAILRANAGGSNSCRGRYPGPDITLKNTVIDTPRGVKACTQSGPPNGIVGDNSVATDNSCTIFVVPRALIMLGPLQDNGGQLVGAPGRERPLLTRMPLPGSGLIDSGSNCSPFDARGFSRPAPCDRGAVEFGAIGP
jgi:hypothetical protein